MRETSRARASVQRTVTHVCADEEAPRKHLLGPDLGRALLAADAGGREPGGEVGQHRRLCALVRDAADLLVVEQQDRLRGRLAGCVGRSGRRQRRGDEALERREGRQKVVDARGQDKLVGEAADRGRLQVVQLQLKVGDVLDGDAEVIGDERQERRVVLAAHRVRDARRREARGRHGRVQQRRQAEERVQLRLLVERERVVRRPVEVDRWKGGQHARKAGSARREALQQALSDAGAATATPIGERRHAPKLGIRATALSILTSLFSHWPSPLWQTTRPATPRSRSHHVRPVARGVRTASRVSVPARSRACSAG